MIDAVHLGEHLRRARERRGLSQQTVAEALGLPRTAVTNIETGNRAVTTLELARLADLYGASPASFFAADATPVEDDPTVVLPRVLASLDGTPAFHAAVQRVWSLCREGAVLRKLLGRAAEPVIPSHAGRLATAGDAVRQGEAIAREERRRLGLGNAPVGPIAEVIGSQGLWVAACPLPTDMSGLFLSHPAVGLTIVVNQAHSAVRRRFSYAHEYGHALCDRDTAWRTTRHGNAHELGETRANAFAAAFLLPPGGVADQLRQLDKGRPSRQLQIVYDNTSEAAAESEVEIRPRAGSQTITWQDARQLARHFGVSYESAVWRLRNLGHITQPEVGALLAQKGKNHSLNEILHLPLDDILPPPPDDAEQTLDGQLVRLAIEAYRREEISAGRLRELAGKLGVSAEALAALAAPASGD